MSNLTTAVVFTVLINIMLFMVGVVMQDVNSSGTVCYNQNSSIIKDNINIVGGNLSTATLNSDFASQLPEQSVITTNTNIITDSVGALVGWAKTGISGVSFLLGIVVSPFNALICAGLPPIFVALIGIIWGLITFILIVAFLFGRDA